MANTACCLQSAPCKARVVCHDRHTMQHHPSTAVKYYNPLTCLALLRCARDQLPQVHKALGSLGLINGKRVVGRVTLVSGA